MPWCLRRLLSIETLSVVASFVLPSIRNRAALRGSLHRRSLTPGEDMQYWWGLEDDISDFEIGTVGYMSKRGVRAWEEPVHCRRILWHEFQAGTNMMDATFQDEDEEWSGSDSDSEDNGFSEVKHGIHAAWSHPRLSDALFALLREVRGARRHPILLVTWALSHQLWVPIQATEPIEDHDHDLQKALLHLATLQQLSTTKQVVRCIITFL